MMSNILDSSDLPACTHHPENMKIYWTDCHAHRCVPEDIFPHEFSSHTTLSSNYPLCTHNILNESSKLHTEVCGLSLHDQTTNIWIDAPIAQMALFVSAFQIDIRLQNNS